MARVASGVAEHLQHVIVAARLVQRAAQEYRDLPDLTGIGRVIERTGELSGHGGLWPRPTTGGVNFIKVRLVSLGLTSLIVVGMLVVLPLIVLGESLLRAWNIPEGFIGLFSVMRWVILAIVMSLGLSVVYRYAPDRPNVKWQWVSWGAIMATLLWLVATALFFVYVQYFASFNESYSLFAGIVVLMMWLNFSGLIVLVGAQINYQLEKRTVLPTAYYNYDAVRDW